MSSLKSSRSPLRMVPIAILAALAATAIAAPGASAAEEAPTDLTISCVPAALETGSVTKCLATAKSPGGAPAGGIRWLGTGSYLELSNQLCELKPVSTKASACSVAITGYLGDDVDVTAGYLPPGASQVEATAAEVVSIEGGSLSVECLHATVTKVPVECEVRVPGTTDGAAAPSGEVAFRAISRFGSHKQQIEPECTLHPTAGGASCVVVYTPAFVEGVLAGGESAVLAEYEGDADHPAEDGTGFVEVTPKHRVKMVASCEYAEPVLFTKFDCSATVRNVSATGGAPTGRLKMFNEGLEAGVLDSTRCTLQPIPGDAKASSCAIQYQPTRLGEQKLDVAYDGNEFFESAFKGSFELNVIKGRTTETEITCQAVLTGQIGKCIAQVWDNGPSLGKASPLGVVSFQASPSSPLLEFVDSFSCALEPVEVRMSHCEIAFRPTKAGHWTVRAKYEGNAAGFALSEGKTFAFAEDPVNAPQ